MANDGSILGLLGSDDLAGFQNRVAQDNIFSTLAPAIQNTKFNTSTWSPTEQAGTSLLQSFLSTALGQIGRNQVSDQVAKVAQILPSLSSFGTDPRTVQAPEGVDQGAFDVLKATSILKQNQRKASLINELFTDPQKLAQISRTNPGVVNQLFGETGSSPIAEKTLPVEAAPVDPLSAALQTGKDSVQDKERAYFAQYVADGYTPSQAAQSAREKIAGEVKANKGSFDDVKAARDRAQRLQDIINTAESGLSTAGTTGPLNPLAHGLDYLQSFWNPDAAKRVAGDAVVDSIAPEIVKMGRSPGAVSDYESRMLINSGPSTRNTPEANQAVLQNFKAIAKIEAEHADFLETYRDINGGSTIGADKKWLQYKNAHPILTTDGDKVEINPNRPSWQEFFSSGGKSDIPKPAASSVSRDAALAELKRRGLIK